MGAAILRRKVRNASRSGGATTLVVPASIEPGVVEVAVEGAGKDVEPLRSPRAGGNAAGEWELEKLRGDRHAERFESAPFVVVPPAMQDVAGGAADEDVDAMGAPATGGRRAGERRREADGW